MRARFAAAALLALGLTATTAAAQQHSRDDLDAKVAAGDAAWDRGEREAAFVAYDAVVRADSSYSRRALLRVGTLHSWGNRFAPAIAALTLATRLGPDDVEARLALARVLSWAGRYQDAEALYDSLKTGAGAAEAERGSAQVKAWRGDLLGAEAAWRAVLARSPDDVDALIGLGTVLRWQGRPFDAQAQFTQALALAPTNGEAREGMRWVRAETAPSSSATLVVADDSERNALTALMVSGAFAWPGNLTLSATARTKRVAQGTGDPAVIPGVDAALYWRPLGALALRVNAGAVQTASGLNASVVQPLGGIRAISRIGPKVTVSGGLSRYPFDDLEATALRRLAFNIADADIGLRLHPRLTLTADVGRTRVTGDLPDNSRTMAGAALTWAPVRGVQGTVTHRAYWWEAPAPGIYFAPQRFTLDEFALQWFRAADLGLIAVGELGAGTQSIRFDGPTDRSVSPRAQVRLGWRAAPGREITFGLLYANVAAAADLTGSRYAYGAATLQGRWVF